MMDRVLFTKGHGTGNDFVILPDPDGALELTPALVAALCDRRRGIGADGVLRVVRSAKHPDGRRFRRPTPSGSWTTGTATARSPRCAATASGSSPATCSTNGLADARPGGPAGGDPGRRRGRGASRATTIRGAHDHPPGVRGQHRDRRAR